MSVQPTHESVSLTQPLALPSIALHNPHRPKRLWQLTIRKGSQLSPAPNNATPRTSPVLAAVVLNSDRSLYSPRRPSDCDESTGFTA